jgi:general stress protein YciG
VYRVSAQDKADLRERMRKLGKKGGEVTKRRAKNDPKYYAAIGRLGGKATAAKAASNPEAKERRRKKLAEASKKGGLATKRIVAAGKAIIDASGIEW